MHENMLATVARLSDEALLAQVKLLAARERGATADLVAHLAELESRRGYLADGWGSLFEYCRNVLRLSEDAAYNRVEAARVALRFPLVLQLMADGSVSVTTVRRLRHVLTPANHVAVLAEAKHRSKREVEVIVARLAPRDDLRPSVRRLPIPAPMVVPSQPLLTTVSTAAAASAPPAPTVLPAPPRPVVAPLSPERYGLRFTVSKATHDKLRRVQTLLRPEIPDGDPGAIFDRALTVLLREVEKQKTAATTKPRPPRAAAPGSRHIPAHVERTVRARDEERCGFVGKSGRCTETAFLELHHIQPHAHQGPATVDNISLRCRAHNVYESELVFGPFDPLVVRETPAVYAVSGAITPVPERRTTTDNGWAALPRSISGASAL